MMCVRVGCQRWGSSRRQAAVPAGGVGACPDNEPTRQATRQHTRSHRCEGRRRAVRGLAAVPVGGGGAWPDNESTRRAKLAARTARGRAAAHGHTKQPGPTAGPSGARNTSGATNKALRAGRRPRAHKAARPTSGVTSNPGLKDKKSWWRVSPSCFGGGLCGGGRARRWRRPIWG